jgi:hypothetical protein
MVTVLMVEHKGNSDRNEAYTEASESACVYASPHERDRLAGPRGRFRLVAKAA